MTAIVVALFGAIVIGETLRPVVRRLQTRMPEPAAIAIAFILLYAIVALLVLLAAQVLVADVRSLAATVSLKPLPADVTELAGRVARDPLHLVPAFSTLGLTLVFALFWLGASTPLSAFVLSLFPADRRAAATATFDEMSGRLAAYTAGTLVNAGIVAIICIVGLSVLHAPNAFILGLLAGALIGVPYLGTVIAAVLTFCAVLPVRGAVSGAEDALLIAGTHTLVGTFVSPLVFKKSVDVDPLGSAVATAIGGTLLGIPGLLLAVPAASVVHTLSVRVIAPEIRRRSTDDRDAHARRR